MGLWGEMMGHSIKRSSGQGKQNHLKALILALPTAAVLSGCGEIYFYDAGLHQTATAAQKQAEDLKLTTVIEKARANRQALVGEAVKLVRRNKELNGKILLAKVVTEDRPIGLTIWEAVEFLDRLDQLGVGAGAPLKKLHDLHRKLPTWAYRLESGSKRVKIYLGIPPTPCLPGLKIQKVDGLLEAVAVWCSPAS